jgi:hypothetical protein
MAVPDIPYRKLGNSSPAGAGLHAITRISLLVHLSRAERQRPREAESEGSVANRETRERSTFIINSNTRYPSSREGIHCTHGLYSGNESSTSILSAGFSHLRRWP